MRFRTLELPLQLFKQKDFSEKIEKINESVFDHLCYLRSIIEKQHQTYLNCFKETRKLISNYEKILQKKQQTQNVITSYLQCKKQCSIIENIQQFLNGITVINQAVEGQLTKNIIFMSSRKNDGLKKSKNILNGKLQGINKMILDYIGNVRAYNFLGAKYIKKADYFKDIEKEPIKYYSLKKNDKNYRRILQIEEGMASKLQQIQGEKNQIKVSMIELSIKISQFYEGIRLSVEESRKIEQSIRDRTRLPKLKSEILEIKEVSESEQFTEGNSARQSFALNKKNMPGESGSDNMLNSGPAFKSMLKKCIKQKQVYLQNVSEMEQSFQNFLNQYSHKIRQCHKEIDEFQNDKNYKKFSEEKMIMSEILAPRCIQDIDIIIIQLNSFQHTYDRIALTLNEKMFAQFFKLKRHIINRYIEEVEGLIEKYKKMEDERYENRIKEIESKFLEAEKNANLQFKENITNLVNRIQGQFENNINISMPKISKKTDLFSKAYFEILKIPYFSQNKKLPTFQRSNIMLEYEKFLEQQKLSKALYDLQNQQEEEAAQKEERKRSTSCCGMRRTCYKKKKHKDTKVDSFSCAIKDGYLFLHGNLTIYEKYLRFKSSFNPETFFGEMDICIAFEDIREIVEGRHLFSLLVSIITKVGVLEFTNFIFDPLKVLMSVYSQATQKRFEKEVNMQENQSSENQLNRLKSKFQDQFIEFADTIPIKIIKYNSYIIDHTLIIQYCYFLNHTGHEKIKKNFQTPFTFKIKITRYEKQNRLEYFFWHSGMQKDVNIKTTLQSITKKLIAEDRRKRIEEQVQKEQEKQSQSEHRISFEFTEGNQPNSEANRSIFKEFMNQNIQDISKIQKRKSTVNLKEPPHQYPFQGEENETPEFQNISPIRTSNKLNMYIEEPLAKAEYLQQDMSSARASDNFSQASTVKYPRKNSMKISEKRSRKSNKQALQQKKDDKTESSEHFLKLLVLLAVIMTFLNILF